jgi:asparagine synthase (glutamine-hydrolysing)
MCGIAGIHYFNGSVLESSFDGEKILDLLHHRGPDYRNWQKFSSTVFFHTRLSIVDQSPASNQPFSDNTHAMVYNGEIFNHDILRQKLSDVHTTGDTEVLFKLLKKEGPQCLPALNGFFAFAFLDIPTNNLLLARDRYGVKPLYYFNDGEKLAFASEIKPLMELAGKQQLNDTMLYTYLRLNFCAGRETIFKNIYRLLPGECVRISGNEVKVETWYSVPEKSEKANLFDLLDSSVQMRLNADVPVGTFLSGGLDSSIVSALAVRHHPRINTFSLGFKNALYFDETEEAEQVANHIGSAHHTLRLSEDDFLGKINPFLETIDEPFADSSAFNIYMLSEFTRRYVKVALSGDGADELFKGYFRHRALLLSESVRTRIFARALSLFLGKSKASRQGIYSNRIRQLQKFEQLIRIPSHEKNKFLASISDHGEVSGLMKTGVPSFYFDDLFNAGNSYRQFDTGDAFDLQTVLADDMLVKADRFSMRHGLEIRTPFLDYRVVEYALHLAKDKKINKNSQKFILRDTFGHLLPKETTARRKKGFELPLQSWLKGPLRSQISNHWLSEEKIKSENIFSVTQVEHLKRQLFSGDPGDSPAKIWALIVFESWLENFSDYIKPTE